MTKPAILWRFLFSIWLLGDGESHHFSLSLLGWFSAHNKSMKIQYSLLTLKRFDLKCRTWFSCQMKNLDRKWKKMIRQSSRLTKTSCWMLLRRNGRFNVLPKISFLGQKIFQKKTPKICLKTDIYLGKGYFFLCTTLPGRGKNMVRV